MIYIRALFKRLIAFFYLSYLKIFHPINFNYHPFQLISLSTKFVINGKGKILLGKKIGTRRNVEFRVSDEGQLKIGANSFFNNGCLINSMEKIDIGSNVQFGPNVMVFDHDHDFRVHGGLKSGDFRKSPIKIGNNVWIGSGCVILRGTTIGDNCVIAAGSILNGEYAPNKIVMQKRQTTVIDFFEK
ncbi:acyltransferase [Paenisporosarcina quisquiliarum]|uniref:Acyltransferase n=1 Tax=Paenisporosarcina quisquiliarum TaxID=365346 RepID=A0A9X3RCX7_9BACL|nr:acyltransferase [Paenisporosarcina quisquiliarum]MCZ8537255.1 acyltransferase [Paenisporosarcina quisquiliarum]